MTNIGEQEQVALATAQILPQQELGREQLVDLALEASLSQLQKSVSMLMTEHRKQRSDFAVVDSINQFEQDESAFITILRASLPIKDRNVGTKLETRCFSGQDLVDWLDSCTSFSRAVALMFCQKMMDHMVFKSIKIGEKTFLDAQCAYYRFVEDYINPKVLNLAPVSDDGNPGVKPVPFADVREVHGKIQLVLQEIITKHTFMNTYGNSGSGDDLSRAERYLAPHVQLIDYKSLASPSCSSFVELQHQLYRLQKCNPLDLADDDDDEKTAFWLNICNAAFLVALLRFGKPTSALSRHKFYFDAKVIVGHYKLSLYDIEHTLLKCSPMHGKPHHASKSHRSPRAAARGLLSGARAVVKRTKSFDASMLQSASISNIFKEVAATVSPAVSTKVQPEDLAISRPVCDPRIHFALITGCLSSPALDVYESTFLNEQLEASTSLYLSNEKLYIDSARKVVTIAQMLNWTDDFGGPNIYDRVNWALKYLEPDQQARVKLLAKQVNKGKPAFSVRWAAYNWTLNSMAIRHCPPRVLDELHLASLQQSLHVRGSSDTTVSDSPEVVTVVTTEDEATLTLHEVLLSPVSRQYLLQFMEKENNAENIHFWIDSEVFVFDSKGRRGQELSAMSQQERIAEAKKLYAKYLARNSEFEINLPAKVLMELQNSLEESERAGALRPGFFDHARRAVEENMQDVYSRFLSSADYVVMIKEIFKEDAAHMASPLSSTCDRTETDDGTATEADELSEYDGPIIMEERKSITRSSQGRAALQELTMDLSKLTQHHAEPPLLSSSSSGESHLSPKSSPAPVLTRKRTGSFLSFLPNLLGKPSPLDPSTAYEDVAAWTPRAAMKTMQQEQQPARVSPRLVLQTKN